MSSEIDEDLYSRQLYVYGKEAMHHLCAARVLICGLSGIGIEIAKNVVLSGVQMVTLFDPTLVTLSDLGSQFFLRSTDVCKRRDLACQARVAELNSYVVVKVAVTFQELSDDLLSGHTVVVLTEYRMEDQLRVNDYCHKNGIKFVVANTCGLAGEVFCDFGPCHVVRDVNGQEPSSAMIEYITKDVKGIVKCFAETPHGLGEDELVIFKDVRGMTELNNAEPRRVEIINIHSVNIGDTSNLSDYKGGGIIQQLKVPITFPHKSLREALHCTELMIGCGEVMSRAANLHLCFRALSKFASLSGGTSTSMPRPWNSEDAAQFVDCVQQLAGETSLMKEQDLDEDAWRIFANTCAGDVPPFKSVIGSFAAQEVIKACSGQFRPLKQWFYLDCWKCLAEVPPSLEEVTSSLSLTENRHYGQIAIFGKDFQDKLANLKYFVAGAGAIGCELLKNLALMGLGTGPQGHVYVTDMDTIEKSNLNRQFLFRPWDIQLSKSQVAVKAIKSINMDLNIESHENRLGPESEDTYNDDFFESLDGVVTALDNVDTRRYLSERCVFYSKPFLDSGTLGTQGSVQLVLPQIRTVYRSGMDTQDKHIPVCTLKSFPYEIHHTIQWSRDLFAGLFGNPSATGAAYIKNSTAFMTRLHDQTARESQQPLEQLVDLLITNRPGDFSDCVTWARELWQYHFVNQIQQILFNFPEDKKTSTGTPFWSGMRFCPRPLVFDANEPQHLDFIIAAANLRAAIFTIPSNRDRGEVARLATRVNVVQFEPDSSVRIAETDEEDAVLSVNVLSERNVLKLTESLSKLDNLSDVNIEAIEFEKDDDTNFHIDFITAASNLRAENYSITPADRLKTKRIAGRIMPAVATTTSLVAGLVCLELYKLVHGHSRVDQFYNNFCNLSLPLFAYVSPIPPPAKEYNGRSFSAWDFFEVQGDISLRDFLQHIKEKHQLTIAMVSQGKHVLYAAYMSDTEILERTSMKSHFDVIIPKIYKNEHSRRNVLLLNDLATLEVTLEVYPYGIMLLRMSALTELVTQKPIASSVRAIPLQLLCESENEEEDAFDVPFVKYFLNR